MRKLKIVGGKAVMEEGKPKKEPDIHYNITYENMYTIGGAVHKTPIKKVFKRGFCRSCGKVFITEEQKYCEYCGVEL